MWGRSHGNEQDIAGTQNGVCERMNQGRLRTFKKSTWNLETKGVAALDQIFSGLSLSFFWSGVFHSDLRCYIIFL